MMIVQELDYSNLRNTETRTVRSEHVVRHTDNIISHTTERRPTCRSQSPDAGRPNPTVRTREAFLHPEHVVEHGVLNGITAPYMKNMDSRSDVSGKLKWTMHACIALFACMLFYSGGAEGTCCDRNHGHARRDRIHLTRRAF